MVVTMTAVLRQVWEPTGLRSKLADNPWTRTQDRDWGVVGILTQWSGGRLLTPLNFHCSVLEADYSMVPQDQTIILYFACENTKKPSRQNIC